MEIFKILFCLDILVSRSLFTLKLVDVGLWRWHRHWRARFTLLLVNLLAVVLVFNFSEELVEGVAPHVCKLLLDLLLNLLLHFLHSFLQPFVHRSSGAFWQRVSITSLEIEIKWNSLPFLALLQFCLEVLGVIAHIRLLRRWWAFVCDRNLLVFDPSIPFACLLHRFLNLGFMKCLRLLIWKWFSFLHSKFRLLNLRHFKWVWLLPQILEGASLVWILKDVINLLLDWRHFDDGFIFKLNGRLVQLNAVVYTECFHVGVSHPSPSAHAVFDLERVLDQSWSILVAHMGVVDHIVVRHLVESDWLYCVTKISVVWVLVQRNHLVFFLHVIFKFLKVVAQ